MTQARDGALKTEVTSFLRAGQTREGGTPAPLWAGLSPPLAHKAHNLRGVPRTPSGDPIPSRPETLPVSKNHRPIYQSLPLDQFKAPRHVHDLILDSEQHLVTK